MKYFCYIGVILIVAITICECDVVSQPINCTRPHEHYECGSACQNECATLGQTCPIVNIRCNDACYCDKGYARNSQGDCIPESQCSKPYGGK